MLMLRPRAAAPPRRGRLRTIAVIGLLALALVAVPASALAKMPYVTIEVTPVEPRPHEPITIVVRTWADPGHTVPGSVEETARAFAAATPILDGLLVVRAADAEDVPVILRRIEPDRFEATIALPSGDWSLVVFPDRSGWATQEVPPGYPDSIGLTVVEAQGSSGPVTTDDASGCPGGCREVTGAVAEATLRLVTFVRET